MSDSSREEPSNGSGREVEREDGDLGWTRVQPTLEIERSPPPEGLVDDWDDFQDPAHPLDETRFFLVDEAEEDSLDEGAAWNVFGEIDEPVDWSVDDYLFGKAMEDFFGVVTFTLIFCVTINGMRFLPEGVGRRD